MAEKLLVTGGAGFIGSNFIRYWLDTYLDDEIINYDLLTYSGNLANLDDVAHKYENRYSFVQGDIADFQMVTETLQQYSPNIIVNFAAESHNSYAISNPGVFYRTNVLGTQTLFDAARKLGTKRIHHISTCEVYGDLPLGVDASFTEKSPLDANTPYSSSKAGADLVARAYFRTFHLPITISNCCNNYGPYQFPEKVIPKFISSALSGEKLTLYKQSQNQREWIHVLDHIRAIDLVLRKGKIGETYNIGTGLELSVEQIADSILGALGLNEDWKKYVNDRPGHDRRYLLDSTKIRTELGWEPQIGFDNGFESTVSWYQKNESWWKPLINKVAVQETQWK